MNYNQKIQEYKREVQSLRIAFLIVAAVLSIAIILLSVSIINMNNSREKLWNAQFAFDKDVASTMKYLSEKIDSNRNSLWDAFMDNQIYFSSADEDIYNKLNNLTKSK